MSQQLEKMPETGIKDSGFARVIPCKTLAVFDSIKWLALALNDFKRAPAISLTYGVIFTLIPWSMYYLIDLTGWYMIIFPAMVCFMLIGPFLAAGLYDVSWQLGKKNEPSFRHSLKAMSRNAVNEWGFAVLLMVLMIFWLRIASLIHAFYPENQAYTLLSLATFLIIGTLVGAALTVFVFFITAFTQPILMERRVDLATAVLTSMNAVWLNKRAMFFWASIILLSVFIGFITFFVAFLVIMPIIGYASWHGYIDTIDVKRKRTYE
ncbi:DUF2189 domain-containing protein [Glaciecola sp. 33A]|jgi:uncharacterized membrane protein|uniref:DUF2189 domain-containing protein n=1 Tax=Glaciecola sp. 33A TaxID=2057807 RepID=UPI000C3203AB|nr:DUF2189 domain-containing protein [Glaciecola sp. 33A]PKI00330.1 hypothetical protein CXF81_19495 [Glaciecola sp. 33A]